MANKQITDLPVAVSMDGTENLEIVQGGTSKRATAALIARSRLQEVNTAIEFVIDEGGVPLTTGTKGYLQVPFDATILTVALLGDQSGSTEIDIWKCSYTAFDAGATAPVAANSITSATPPTIVAGTKYSDTALSGWTTSIDEGDVLAFVVNSNSSFTRITVSLGVERLLS